MGTVNDTPHNCRKSTPKPDLICLLFGLFFCGQNIVQRHHNFIEDLQAFIDGFGQCRLRDANIFSGMPLKCITTSAVEECHYLFDRFKTVAVGRLSSRKMRTCTNGNPVLMNNEQKKKDMLERYSLFPTLPTISISLSNVAFSILI